MDIDLDEINDPNVILPDTNTTNHIVLAECGPYNGSKWNYDEKVNMLVQKFCE